MATAGRPAVTAGTICSVLGKTIVSGPGQNDRDKSSADSGQAVTYRLAMDTSAT